MSHGKQCGCEIQSLELNVPQGLEVAGCCQHAVGSRPVERPDQIAGYVARRVNMPPLMWPVHQATER